MKTWICSICGFQHQGEIPPETCPVCNQPAEKFVEKEDEE